MACNARRIIALVVALGFVSTPTANAVDVFVGADANISTLVTADDTVLHFLGNHTITVDATTTKTLAGINAAGNNAVFAFGGNAFKVLMGNSAGDVLIQTGGGDISITGTNVNAGFQVSPALSGEIVEFSSTNIDDTDNANRWFINNNILKVTNGEAGLQTLVIGGSSARIDIDERARINAIVPTGNVTVDLAASKNLTVISALDIAANTISIIGQNTASTYTGTINLNNNSSLINVSGTATLATLTVGASGGLTLADAANFTITNAANIGANTLTVSGTTGSSAETLTTTGGIALNDADSVLKIAGDSANPIVITKVDIATTDLNAGKGVDVDESASITALTISNNATVDVASGKTLSGTTTLNAAKSLILNNTGTVNTINTTTAAGTVQITGQATVNTLTNSFAGVTIDANESATITNLAANENTTVDVATGKTLTTTATIAASKVLTTRETGTISNVTLNGANAELNVTTASGVINTLNVNVDGGILDADIACTIDTCTQTAAAGNLTVENTGVTITSANGFDVNDNTLTISEASGSIGLVTVDTAGGTLDINENTSFTTLNLNANTTVDVAPAKTLSTNANVNAGSVVTYNNTGITSVMNLTGSGAELNMTASGQVSTVNVTGDGGILDLDVTCTLTGVNMTPAAGNCTLDIAAGRSLSSSIDVNDNTLTIDGPGIPGTIRMDTDNGRLDINENTTPTSLDISANVAIDVATDKTLSGVTDINTRTLTASGSGTFARIDASTGEFACNGNLTVTDLRANFGASGTFTFGGSGDCTITSMSNSAAGPSETFRKIGTGELTIASGFSNIFSKATGIKLDIDGGEVILGSAGNNDDVTFNDDGDEITLASGATLTTFGSFNAQSAGANVNLDAEEGSIINLQSASGAETITATQNNDFQLLGTVNIDGSNGDYTFAGGFVHQFGDVNINAGNALICNTPSATLEFIPGSTIDVAGSRSSGGTLTVNGQAASTPILLTTTTGDGTFTIDRNNSENMTIENATISRSTYTSSSRGDAKSELGFASVTDDGGNVNWFTPAEVIDDDNDDDMDINDDVVDDMTDEPVDDDSRTDDDPTTFIGDTITVDSAGDAIATSTSTVSDASGFVTISDASAGSLRVTVADGNIRDNFDGIPNGNALPVTMSVSDSVTGPFTVVVELCYTEKLLGEAGLSADELVLYTYAEPEGPWVLAGNEGQYQGDTLPTDTVGDHGYDSTAMCVWAVRDDLSDFAIGAGDTTLAGNDDAPPMAPQMCGLFGMVTLPMLTLGLITTRRVFTARPSTSK